MYPPGYLEIWWHPHDPIDVLPLIYLTLKHHDTDLRFGFAYVERAVTRLMRPGRDARNEGYSVKVLNKMIHTLALHDYSNLQGFLRFELSTGKRSILSSFMCLRQSWFILMLSDTPESSGV
jgi:hypothetical protein